VTLVAIPTALSPRDISYQCLSGVSNLAVLGLQPWNKSE
jgi:hypothetical protein